MGLVCSSGDHASYETRSQLEPISILRPVTHRLLERFTVKPFGVLGISDLGPVPGVAAVSPGSALDAVVVDAAKTDVMLANAPFQAKAVSQSIYTWLGMFNRSGAYPDEVWHHFEQAGRDCERMAKYHRYSDGQHVIHAVGPHLRKMDQSIRDLIDTYASILWEFCEAIGPDPEEMVEPEGASSTAITHRINCNETAAPRRLRLLPLSSDGGVLTQELIPHMGRIFWSALAIALERLPAILQRRLESAVVEVCIYKNQQVRMFEEALREKWKGCSSIASEAMLKTMDGSHDWVRHGSGLRDRFLRLRAASATMKSISEQGYVLPDGSGVGLNHVNRMLAGTRLARYGAQRHARQDAEKQQNGDLSSKPKVATCVDESATIIELATAYARKDKRVSAVLPSTTQRIGAQVLSGDRHGLEEEWCMTTTLLKSLQHADFLCCVEGKTESKNHKEADSSNDLDIRCILSPCVEVFRESSDHGYMFMAEPATLHCVVSMALDTSKFNEDLEALTSRVCHTLVSAAVESGAQVLLVPYCRALDTLKNPVVSGTILGHCLLKEEFLGAFEEVVIVGDNTYAQAVACVARGEVPESTPETISSMFVKGERNCPETETLERAAPAPECMSRNMSRRGWSKTPRHASSDFLSKHYTEVREIGSGAFGRVTLVIENATQEERVCKIVSLAGMKEETIQMLRKEAELLRSLDHPGVVRLYEYAEDEKMEQIIMILEHVKGGGCDELLQQSMGVKLSESLVVRIISQLLSTLAFCHDQGIIHRDIKPENIMLSCKPIWSDPTVKLIDFGAAAHDFSKQEVIGTVEYMSPELLKGKDGGAATDIWAVGVAAFELLLGEPPFGCCDDSLTEQAKRKGIKDAGEMVQQRILDFSGSLEDVQSHTSIPLWHKWQCRDDRFWERISEEAQDFFKSMLMPDPKKRPSARQALEHPWIMNTRPEPCRLTQEMGTSLASYMHAPRVIQCCMVVVAASLGATDFEDIGAVFLSADRDCDGMLSIKELRHALAYVSQNGEEPTTSRNRDGPIVKDSLLSGEFQIGQGLGFTEFLAACSYIKQTSMDRLIEEAFHGLDVNRYGYITIQEARAVFDPDPQLPDNHTFTLAGWCSTIKACISGIPVAESEKETFAKAPSSSSAPTVRIRRRGRSACC